MLTSGIMQTSKMTKTKKTSRPIGPHPRALAKLRRNQVGNTKQAKCSQAQHPKPTNLKKPVSNVKPDKLSTDTAGSVRTQLLPTVEARFVPLKQPDTQLKQIADLIRAKIDC